MKRALTFMILLTLATSLAGAQMMGGRHGMPGQTPGSGSTMTPGGYAGAMLGMGGARGEMGSHGLIVTPQGGVIVTRAFDANGDGLYERELVALTSAGTKSWSKTLASTGFLLGLSNDLLLAVEQPATIDLTKPFTTTLVAYDAATGVEKWRLAIDGMPMGIEAFSGGTYLTVVNRSIADGMRALRGTAALWAISPGGTVLWKYDLAN